MGFVNKRFQGEQIVFGCALYVAVAMGCMGIYVTSVAQLPKVYHISITNLGTLGTLMSLTCMIGSALLISIKKRIGARGCLYLGGTAMIIQAVAVFLLQKNLASLLVELMVCGLVVSISAQTVLSEIISNWYAEKRAEKIAIMLGAASLGSAFYQFISGQILGRFPYFVAVGGLSLTNGILMLLLVHFVIYAEKPEQVGQQPFGTSRKDLSPGNIETVDASAKVSNIRIDKKYGSKNLYTCLDFWLLLLATMLAAGNTTYILNYTTTFFTELGMHIKKAAALLSLLSLSSGICSFISGKLLKRLRVKRFLCLLVGAAITANLGMILYEHTSSPLVVMIIIVSYGIGGLIPTAANLISGELFAREDAVNVASKCYAVYAGTNILLAPVCAAMIDNFGFSSAFCMVASLCGASLIFYLPAVCRCKA